MATEHKLITDPNIHEPKGVASAGAGQVYIADGAGGGAWTALGVGTIIGLFDYNDLATATTPISVTGGAGYVYLTNDELGAFTNKLYPPTGVTDVWDATAQKFDFDDLVLGDMIDIRIDIDVTTTGANTVFDVVLELATDGSSYDILWDTQNVKSAGTVKVNQYNGIYMGDLNTLNNRARFKIQSDANTTVKVNGWYCKVLINR
jgi:hypothetical protein